ncbi:amidohydrolase family protein [Plesiocystis pacifica]|uniref:amidohydrolase family protein n=1 Tax=Plesiocystis pacifica TaxID=191768 RepID=UPI0002DD8BD1|nr:amidohydrolase family protein [Plesiocystis pacifica]
MKADRIAPSRPFALLGALGLVALACTPGSSTPAGELRAPPSGVTVRDAGMEPPEWCADGDASVSADEDCTWKVDSPPGTPKEVTLDTSTGTWMNLDVSPDGATIVFDLLGDLYSLPMAGGEAKALTEGVAWDMQPRFSPDGQWLAFTSDRGGGDNLWVMPADGSDEPRPVTSESFRLITAPAWSPDGEYLVGRKHFTSRRSIGSGEMWLYHRSGGKGVQLTKKRTEQKDSGEPVFSPDGRYLYFSEDMTPGGVFEYNKDPNGQIYAIRRLDLEEGRLESIVGGPGGAVRPTPSPDGKYLAYVRRVRLKSVLFVRELESGKEWPVYDALDRDMQETWAIHGVYPQMDWTPDGEAIVFWSGGKIHKVGREGGEATIIDFHVEHTRTVYEARRNAVEVAPESFDVKVLRWPQLSPDGSKVVYQALGKLHVRDMQSGEVRRLTTQDEHMEYYPSLSRDGRFVTYVSWDDEQLGSVRVVPIEGGAEGRVVTPTPGHYVEPVMAPDNSTVVYRRTRGGGLMSPRWSENTGIYAVPFDSKPARRGRRGAEAAKPVETRVSRGGSEPHFGADSERVFLIDGGPDDSRVLVSMALDGSERREHAKSARAEQFAVSPDGRWLAFVEGFRVHVAAFPTTGTTVDVGPNGGGLPSAKVSEQAGWFVHWSGDGKALHWILGPELMTRPLNDVFDFLDGSATAEKPAEAEAAEGEGEKQADEPEPKIERVNVGFSVPTDAPTGKLALVGGKLVTMKGDEIIESGTLVIEGNRIVAIGAKDQVQVPGDATVIDVSGHTLIPGLVDVHAHGPQASRGMQPEQNYLHYSELSFGVTTVHDPSNDSLSIFSSAELVNAGETVGPRIYSTGTILYGAEGSFRAQIETLDDARMHMGRMKAIGAISVKSYNQPRRDQRQKVLQAAREMDMMVVPEGGSLFMHNMTMVVDGHTGVEHAIPVGSIYDDVRQLWGGTDVGYTPTLVVAYGGVWGENYFYQHDDVWAHPRLMAFVPRQNVDPRSRRRMHVGEDDWNHVRAASIAKELNDVGVKVNLGAHGQREGLAAHWELWSFVLGGMTPHEALRASTLNGAYYVGLDADLGSLEVGKLADVAVIAGDPLADIRVSDDVAYTVVNGRIFDAATMAEVGNHPRDPSPLWWQIDADGQPEDALDLPSNMAVAGPGEEVFGEDAYCHH